MGILRKPVGTGATWDPVALALPFVVQPRYAGWYGSTLARSRRNLAAPRLAAADVVGAPSVTAAGMVTLQPSAYLSVPIAESAAQTIYVVARSDQDQSGSSLRMAVCGWSASEGGLALFSGGNGLMRVVAKYNGTIRTFTWGMPAGAHSTYRRYALVQVPGVGIRAYDLTAGTVTTFADTTARDLAPTNAFRIGSVIGGPTGSCQLLACFAIPAALTQDQLQRLNTAVVARAALLNGLTL